MCSDQISTCVAHKKKSQMALGIKNSWKYEKDLIQLLNAI